MSAEAPQRDPAERHPILRWFYRDWRPTWLGRAVNRLDVALIRFGQMTGLVALLESERRAIAVLEVRGRRSGRRRLTPVVIATIEGVPYLVSMLGPRSDWVRNVDAAGGEAVLWERRRRAVRLVAVPPAQRAPILRTYVGVATSGRHHFPLAAKAPLEAFQGIAGHYPVYRVEPAQPR